MAADLVVLLCLAAAAAAVEGEAGDERPGAGGGFGMERGWGGGGALLGDPPGAAGPAEGLRAAPGALRFGEEERPARCCGAAAVRCRSPPHLLSTAGAPRASRAPNSLLVGQRTSALPGASHVGPDASLRAPSPPRPPGDALGWYRCGLEQRSPRLFACRPDPGRPRSAHGAAALVGLRASRRRGVPRGPRLRESPRVRLLLHPPVASLVERAGGWRSFACPSGWQRVW